MTSGGFDTLRAVVGGQGAGVVARYPGLLCVAISEDAEPLQQLLELCRDVSGPSPGRILARRLAGWLGGPDAPPDSLQFGTLAAAGQRLAVFLSGSVSALVPDQSTTVSGADTAAWSDRLLDLPDTAVVLTVGGVEVPVERLPGTLDLRVGVVPGAAVVLMPVTAPAIGQVVDEPAGHGPEQVAEQATERARTVAPPSEPEPAESGQLAVEDAPPVPDGDGPAWHSLPVPSAHAPPPELPPPRRAEPILGVAPDEQRVPLDTGVPGGLAGSAVVPASTRNRAEAAEGPAPDAAETADGPAADSDAPRARGHLCSRGHLNDPRSHFCVLCGIRMNERTGVLVLGSRPPLGLVVLDDGATYTVDADYLIGRTPEGDKRVSGGSFRAITMEDREGAISRVHGEIRVKGWDVVLVDSGSHNGTYVAVPGATSWVRVPPRQAHRLVPGTRVRMGGRMFVFESPSGVR